MSDQHQPTGDPSPFDQLISAAPAAPGTSFATAFRGYDKEEVDAAVAQLKSRQKSLADEVAQLKDRHHRVTADAKASAKKVTDLEDQVALLTAQAATAEDRVQTLSDELLGAGGESVNRQRFEEVLHVAEEQASVLIKNASIQADRLLAAAHEEIQSRRAEAQADADAIIARAEHDAQQARLRIDTEITAHEAQLEREKTHAAEKVQQAEQEAAAIRTEAEKGAAALRAMTTRESEHTRGEAEEAVRQLRVRALEFEESLTRRQDDAQQEFLVLHNQAVAHAERITQDANDQVAASLEHAQRVSAKADDFDRLMRAQAQQIEADAAARSRETLERARVKAQKIIDTVTNHSQSVLRDAEDRTRQLRWQQHQLTSFMAEVTELMRGDAARLADGAPADDLDVDAKTFDVEVADAVSAERADAAAAERAVEAESSDDVAAQREQDEPDESAQDESAQAEDDAAAHGEAAPATV
ncbi:DivIVA domain-containing protein [Microbacterium invictum]|uniref:DivIVA domain-containing protein n=1 Tax=Microbacterium invictum TaxID=515415 RepID=A0AA40SPY3_9MICO|nr:DivIVA domain-containing protein [Microbacterium invictum]MBB4140196.1 DivIVA domain-containing protein [Microbacterium invictum]